MKILTGEEFAELIRENRWRVWMWAREILGKAGDPPGIRVNDLVNVGYQAIVDAAMDDGPASYISFEIRAKVAARSKMKTWLDQLQVGAVARTRRSDGTRAHHTYAESTDIGAFDDRSYDDPDGPGHDDDRPIDNAKGLNDLRKVILRAARETGRAAWFEARSDLRLDFTEALRRIPDPRDQSLVGSLLKLNDAPPSPWGRSSDENQEATEQLWAHYNSAMGVLVAEMESCGITAAETRARLGAAGTWINAYCNGRPLRRYPLTTWHEEDSFTMM